VPEKYKCDIVFAGHYEDDGRISLLDELCRSVYSLNLFGGGWDRAYKQLNPNGPLRKNFPVHPVTGDDYRRAICGAKIALCVLSTLNKDT
jgi:spore maturation protein CgeB